MKTRLAITDLTRMREGRVCIAGYDEAGQCIRPVLPPPGIQEISCLVQGKAIVFPFALVEYDLLAPIPQPPHTEDHRYDPTSVKFIRRLDDAQTRKVLDQSLFSSVSAIFEQPILTDVGTSVMDGQGPRSLGTLLARRIIKAIYEKAEDKFSYRLGFVDGEASTYWLTITDLAWRYYCDQQRREGLEANQISTKLTSALRSATVYLRIGLARGWEKYPERCFLQITGVHTFPDYLHGKTFADFAPGSRP